MTICSDPGPAPNAQVRRSASASAASSWRTWPKVKARKKVPSVDGAMTRCGSTAAVAPERSTSAWSMCEPPATMACTNVSTLRPGIAPPTRPKRPTVALTRDSRSRRATSVATNNKPALATRLGSSKVTPIRSILRDTDPTESASWCWVNRVFEQRKFSQAGRHFPRMRGLLRSYLIGGSRLSQWVSNP